MNVGKIALILGIVGIVLGSITLLVCVMLPVVTNEHVSWNEAMFGIIPGALVLTGSFVLAIVGLVVILMKRKKAAA